MSDKDEYRNGNRYCNTLDNRKNRTFNRTRSKGLRKKIRDAVPETQRITSFLQADNVTSEGKIVIVRGAARLQDDQAEIMEFYRKG